MTKRAPEPYRLYVLCKRDLLGPDGNRVSSVLAQPKRLCLLTYLALAQQPVSRATLTALFWPDADEVRARNNLNQALHYLRRSMSKGVVESVDGDEFLRVAPDRLWCDARELLHGGPVNGEFAAAAHREVLEGWNAEDSQPLQDWLDGVRREAKRKVEALESSPPPPAPVVSSSDTLPGAPWRRLWNRYLGRRRSTVAVGAAIVLAATWALVGMPLPGAPASTGVTVGVAPVPSTVTIVFHTPRLIGSEAAPPLLGELIRHQILAKLTDIQGIVVQEDFSTGIAWDRRQLAAITQPRSLRRYLEVITIVSGRRLDTTVALVGPGGTIADASSLPFATEDDLLAVLPEQIARRVATIVAVAVVSADPAGLRNDGAPVR